MAHPRVEEVEDSDVDMSDPSEGDIDDFDESDILRARSDKQQQLPIRQQQQQPPQANPHILNPSHIPSVSAGPPAGGEYAIPTTTTTTAAGAKAYAHFQCLYPVYFDARRTRAGGRRVGKGLAVPNPLARELVNACRALRLQTLFEPEKTHPKDWANPGRVKVHLRGDNNGGNSSGGIKNKHQLYLLVAQHLRNHPTTDDKDKNSGGVLWERIPGGPPPPDRAKPYPRPAVPRGWAMGDLLPYYSPAMTGGGVSENLFKDMMKEMQGGGAPGGGGGMPALPGGMDMASLMSAMGGGGGGLGGLMGGGSPGTGSGNASEDGGGGKKKGKKGKGKA